MQGEESGAGGVPGAAGGGAREDTGEAAGEVVEPAPGVRLLRLGPVDVTVGIVAGPSGVLLVDPGPTPSAGAAVRAYVEQAFEAPVRWLVYSHGHWDHVYGAAAFGAGGGAGAATGEGAGGGPRAERALVWGAAGLGAELARDAQRQRRDALRYGVAAAEARDAVARLRAPDREVAEVPARLDLGGGREAVLLHPGPGHTRHDLVVVVRDAPHRAAGPTVVFCGDLVEESGPPQAGPDAAPDAWPAALDRLLEAGGGDAVYVPGHGAPVDAGFVRRQRDALAYRRRNAKP